MCHLASDKAMDNHKYRFDVISTISKRQEPYIGIFKNKDEALNWSAIHGRWHKKMGRPLILVKCETLNSEPNNEDQLDYIEEQ